MEVIVDNKITDNNLSKRTSNLSKTKSNLSQTKSNLSKTNNILYSDKWRKKTNDVGYSLIGCFSIIIGILIPPIGVILLIIAAIGYFSEK